MRNIRTGRSGTRRLLMRPIDAAFETGLAVIMPVIMGAASMRWASHLNNHEPSTRHFH